MICEQLWQLRFLNILRSYPHAHSCAAAKMAAFPVSAARSACGPYHRRAAIIAADGERIEMARRQTGFTVCKLWRWAIPTPWPRSPQFANCEHRYADNTRLALPRRVWTDGVCGAGGDGTPSTGGRRSAPCHLAARRDASPYQAARRDASPYHPAVLPVGVRPCYT